MHTATYPAVTLAQIKKLSPCECSWNRVSAALKAHGVKARQKITARDAADAGCTLDDIAWIASAVSRGDKDVDRRLRLWMADCAARVLHIYERDYPADARVRDAVIAARQYARGEISAAARDAAWDAARDAAWAAAWDAAWDAEEKWQTERLILWLTDEPTDWPLDAVQAEAA